MIQAKFAKDYM